MLVLAKLHNTLLLDRRNHNTCSAGLTKSTLHFKAHTYFVGVAGLGKTALHIKTTLIL